MIMDVNQRREDVSGTEIEMKVNQPTTTTTTTITKKRSFDVAFLMLPDEKLKQKQLKASKQAALINNYPQQVFYDNNNVIEENGAGEETVCIPPEDNKSHLTRIMHNAPKIFDDPSLGKPKMNCMQKSAFTKVKESRLSPNLSVSPELSYQNSLSPSPPILNHRQYFPPNQIFKSQNIAPYQNNFLQESFPTATPSTSAEILQPNFSKMRPLIQYRPELPYLGGNPYHSNNFQPQDLLKISPPAATILTSLLPPSFAALSLPAQNICAKCNISFRMTSDLVYHMRSHHKSEVANDLSKRRREDKLKCPVCAELFRERHHLTRHMTAHQDKEGDVIEPGLKKKTAYVNNTNYGK